MTSPCLPHRLFRGTQSPIRPRIRWLRRPLYPCFGWGWLRDPAPPPWLRLKPSSCCCCTLFCRDAMTLRTHISPPVARGHHIALGRRGNSRGSATSLHACPVCHRREIHLEGVDEILHVLHAVCIACERGSDGGRGRQAAFAVRGSSSRRLHVMPVP